MYIVSGSNTSGFHQMNQLAHEDDKAVTQAMDHHTGTAESHTSFSLARSLRNDPAVSAEVQMQHRRSIPRHSYDVVEAVEEAEPHGSTSSTEEPLHPGASDTVESHHTYFTLERSTAPPMGDSSSDSGESRERDSSLTHGFIPHNSLVQLIQPPSEADD